MRFSGDSHFIDSKMISDAAMALKMSREPLDRELSEYRTGAVLGHSMFFAPPPSPIDVLDLTLREVSKKDKGKAKVPPPPRDSRDGNWALRFLMEIFVQLRKIICGTAKSPGKLGNKSQAALTALAAFLAHRLGVSDSTALGVAVLVLLSLGNASKAAFCRM